MNDQKWTSSLDGELFIGEIFETKEQVIESMTKDVPGEDFWVGQIEEITPRMCVNADDFMDKWFRERGFQRYSYKIRHVEKITNST